MEEQSFSQMDISKVPVNEFRCLYASFPGINCAINSCKATPRLGLSLVLPVKDV